MFGVELEGERVSAALHRLRRVELDRLTADLHTDLQRLIILLSSNRRLTSKLADEICRNLKHILA